MKLQRAHSLRVHSDAELSLEDKGKYLTLKLKNKLNDKEVERNYYKLADGIIDAHEANKINMIVYHMHNHIGLNVWDDLK